MLLLTFSRAVGMKKKPSFAGDKRQSSKKTFDSESKADKRLQNLSGGGGYDVSMKQLRVGVHQQPAAGAARQITPRQRPVVSTGPIRRAPDAVKPIMAFRKFENAQGEDAVQDTRGHASVGECYDDEQGGMEYQGDDGEDDRGNFRDGDADRGERGYSSKNKGSELFERGAEKARMK